MKYEYTELTIDVNDGMANTLMNRFGDEGWYVVGTVPKSKKLTVVLFEREIEEKTEKAEDTDKIHVTSYMIAWVCDVMECRTDTFTSTGTSLDGMQSYRSTDPCPECDVKSKRVFTINTAKGAEDRRSINAMRREAFESEELISIPMPTDVWRCTTCAHCVVVPQGKPVPTHHRICPECGGTRRTLMHEISVLSAGQITKQFCSGEGPVKEPDTVINVFIDPSEANRRESNWKEWSKALKTQRLSDQKPVLSSEKAEETKFTGRPADWMPLFWVCETEDCSLYNKRFWTYEDHEMPGRSSSGCPKCRCRSRKLYDRAEPRIAEYLWTCKTAFCTTYAFQSVEGGGGYWSEENCPTCDKPSRDKLNKVVQEGDVVRFEKLNPRVRHDEPIWWVCTNGSSLGCYGFLYCSRENKHRENMAETGCPRCGTRSTRMEGQT